MERTKFKAFQPVLVRNSNEAHWKTAHYSNYNEQRKQHFCDNQPWEQVIPFNEETAHLIGTTNPVIEKSPNMDIEVEKYFGKHGWGLSITRTDEQSFQSWWQRNKDIPYDNYYYEVACHIWDRYEEETLL